MQERLELFLGYDKREAIGFHACVQSIIATGTENVAIHPLQGYQRDGTNAFIYARFLVPMLCGYEGTAIFADGSDMIFLRDVREALHFHIDEGNPPVSVVKREYKTRHKRKYIGTSMESDNRDYPRKNWSSLIVFNCGHPRNRILTQDFVDGNSGADLHRFCWLMDSEIGALPLRWNVLIGEDGENENDPAVLHYTLGIPAFTHYANCLHSERFFDAVRAMTNGAQL
jgi:hypothetical protein